MSNNIYRQAAELLDKNHDYKLSEEELERLQKREITPIIVPDGDADHA